MDYLANADGRLSKLEVKINCWQPGAPPPLSEEEKLLLQIFGEEESEEQLQNYPGKVLLELSVDTFTPGFGGALVDITALIASSIDSDEYYLFTCSCGYPGCAGIDGGIEVVHEDELVVWRDHDSKPMRVAVFNRKEYRSEIFSKVRQALALHKEMGPKAIFGAGNSRKMAENTLHQAERDGKL